MDESQIRDWLRTWLRFARQRAGHSQESAARQARVGIGTIRATEQTGRLLELDKFLRLIVAYGEAADMEMVKQIREWRAASAQPIRRGRRASR